MEEWLPLEKCRLSLKKRLLPQECNFLHLKISLMSAKNCMLHLKSWLLPLQTVHNSVRFGAERHRAQ